MREIGNGKLKADLWNRDLSIDMIHNEMRSISFAVLYGCVSVATTIFTKMVVSSFGFNHTPILVLLEKLAIIIFLSATSERRMMNDVFRLALKTPMLSMVSLLNALVSITSLEGISPWARIWTIGCTLQILQQSIHFRLQTNNEMVCSRRPQHSNV